MRRIKLVLCLENEALDAVLKIDEAEIAGEVVWML